MRSIPQTSSGSPARCRCARWRHRRTWPGRSWSSPPTNSPATSPAKSLPSPAGWRGAFSMVSFWTGGLAHWDDVERRHSSVGHLSAHWRDLGRAAGSVAAGVKRIEVERGKWSTPAHVQGAEEEIFYVLGGSGLLWQDEQAHEIRPGD